MYECDATRQSAKRANSAAENTRGSRLPSGPGRGLACGAIVEGFDILNIALARKIPLDHGAAARGQRLAELWVAGHPDQRGSQRRAVTGRDQQARGAIFDNFDDAVY